MAAYLESFLVVTYFLRGGRSCLRMSRTAEARPDPAPKPSGIVIHLFGPNSVTTHLPQNRPMPEAL